MTLLGEDAAAAAAGCGGGSTDSVSDAAESKPGCCGRPDESPLPETTVGIGGYNKNISVMMMWMCGEWL